MATLTPQQFLDFLRGPTTERGMETYMVSIAGSLAASGSQPYYIYADGMRGSITGQQNTYFRMSPEAMIAGATQFQVHSIQMVNRSTIHAVNAIPGYMLDNTGPDIMVTGMLTGCTFLCRKIGNNMEVAHIQPAPGTDGYILNDEMMGAGVCFANSGGASVTAYGRKIYKDNHCHVIAVRKGNGWSVYAQESTHGFSDDVKIMRVSQIL